MSIHFLFFIRVFGTKEIRLPSICTSARVVQPSRPTKRVNIFQKRGAAVSLFKSVSTLRFGMIKNPYSKKSDDLVKARSPKPKNGGWLDFHGRMMTMMVMTTLVIASYCRGYNSMF